MLKNLRDIIWQRINRKLIYSSASYWDFKATNHDDSAVSMWPNILLNDLYEDEQGGFKRQVQRVRRDAV